MLALFAAGSGHAQSVHEGALHGTVVDAETDLPVIGAHVFVGSTLIGTVTDREGAYSLKRVPAGAHSLWVSMMGYEPSSQEFAIEDAPGLAPIRLDFSLEPAVLQVGELTVTAKRDRRWKKRLRRFEDMFLGETPFSRQTEILNPEVLDFDANWLGSFKARAQAPLHIENRALGYKIKYVLKEFERNGSTIRYDGDPLFEELLPETLEDRNRWLQNRQAAFYGSFHHFLLALLDGKTDEEGFELMHIPSEEDIARNQRRFGITAEEIVMAGEKPSETLLSFHGLIEITYLNERESLDYLRWKGRSPHRSPAFQRSWIQLTDGPTAIDPNGEIIDPYGVTVYGYYAYERVADELPKEYRPPDNVFSNR